MFPQNYPRGDIHSEIATSLYRKFTNTNSLYLSNRAHVEKGKKKPAKTPQAPCKST